ncbi:MAG: DUF3198 domain-containing protein [Thermoplasmata archaeon]|nr:DUF3198 domain-containing protein [Thermoplasmata archaeon]
MGIDQYFHEHKMDLSVSMIIIGTILVVISVGAIISDIGEDGIFSTIKDSTGGWIYWLLIFSGTILSLGLFYFLDFIAKRREFYKIFEERSKSKFVKNLDRIEELAWRLQPKYEEMVIDKKKKLKIR